MFDNGSGRNKQSLERTCHRCFLLSFGSFGQVVSEEKIFFKSANQKQELPMVAMFVNGSGQNDQSLERTFHRCFLPSFTSLAEGFQRRKLKCEKLTDDRRWTTDANWWQKLTLPLAKWAKKCIIQKNTLLGTLGPFVWKQVYTISISNPIFCL